MLIARMLATAAIWVRIQTFLKNKWATRLKQRIGQHSLARQMNVQKKEVQCTGAEEYNNTDLPQYGLKCHFRLKVMAIEMNPAESYVNQ